MPGKRLLLLITLAIVACCLFIGLTHGFYAVWTPWKIPPMQPPFADLRNLTGGAESLRMGLDPLFNNPMDPARRPMNHPRLVQFIVSVLDLDLSKTIPLGLLFIVLFFVGLFIATPPISTPTALILALAIFSPSVMLGFERGNHDLFIFFLVSLAIRFARIPILSFFTLYFAACIKLFPAFGALLFLRYQKATTRLLTLLGFIGAFITYLIINLKDLPQVFASTGKSYGLFAYGLHTFSEYGTFHSYIPFLAITITCLALFRQSLIATGTPQSISDERYIDGFRTGAGIFLGTFLLGHNYVYRLIFLMFAIPQLVAWIKPLDTRRSSISLLALGMALMSLWMPIFRESGFPRWFFVADEVSNWLLYSSLLCLMLSALPPGIQIALTAFGGSPVRENRL